MVSGICCTPINYNDKIKLIPLIDAEQSLDKNSALNRSANSTITNPSLLSKNNSDIEGILKVVVTVNNKNIGNKSPSDFNISVHANNPSPSSFAGNSSGTAVILDMGMYSVSENYLKGYMTYFSPDCFGGIMSSVTKKCTINNIYANLSS